MRPLQITVKISCLYHDYFNTVDYQKRVSKKDPCTTAKRFKNVVSGVTQQAPAHLLNAAFQVCLTWVVFLSLFSPLDRSQSPTDTNTSLSLSDNVRSTRIARGIATGRHASISEVTPRPTTQV